VGSGAKPQPINDLVHREQERGAEGRGERERRGMGKEGREEERGEMEKRGEEREEGRGGRELVLCPIGRK